MRVEKNLQKYGIQWISNDSLLKEGIFSYHGKYGNKDGRNHFERVNLFFVMAKL